MTGRQLAKRLQNQQPLRVKATQVNGSRFHVGGWLSGRATYLWFGTEDGLCYGSLDGQQLYRLAKAIVRHMDEDKG